MFTTFSVFLNMKIGIYTVFRKNYKLIEAWIVFASTVNSVERLWKNANNKLSIKTFFLIWYFYNYQKQKLPIGELLISSTVSFKVHTNEIIEHILCDFRNKKSTAKKMKRPIDLTLNKIRWMLPIRIINYFAGIYISGSVNTEYSKRYELIKQENYVINREIGIYLGIIVVWLESIIYYMNTE